MEENGTPNNQDSPDKLLIGLIVGLEAALIELVAILDSKGVEVGSQMLSNLRERQKDPAFDRGMQMVSGHLADGLELIGVTRNNIEPSLPANDEVHGGDA